VLKYLKVNIYIFIFFIILSYSYKSFSTELSEEAYNWLKEFISIDTVNPPGNEINAVNFYKNIFIKENIDFNQAESSPNRGNIWARIKGGNKPALILLQHTDVVPANKENWTVDPFKPTEINNYLYGRGTLDMKGTGISQLATFLHLKRAGKKLNRDIIFLATADEEAGGNYGVGWLIQKHPEIFKNVGFLLNEGGSGRIVNDKLVFEIELTQKVPVWLRFESEGKPGHGSSPYESSSVTRLLDGLQHLKNNPFPPKIIPSVGDYFQGLSKIVNEEYSNEYKDIKKSIKKEEFIKALQKRSPFHHSLTRDTCSITRLGASNKINVVPPLAWAEIDCRILPDQPAEEFIFKITKMMEPFGIKVKKLMAFTPASSSIDTEFYKIIRSTLLNLYPEAHIIPRVTTGFTDSHFTRDIGINSYGFNPIIIPLVEFRRIHGNDERVNINAFKTSIYDHLKIIENFVYD
tara:strand:+ start:10987 stop:12372 length:1386 start_codon:yes stop_codon:yes gene_type:complete